MGNIFGGGSSKSTTEINLPGYVEAGGSQQYGIANSLQMQPYVPYQGPRIAPYTADENAAFDYARNSVGQWQPDLNASRQMIDYATTPWSDTQAQQYMDPYAKNVTDIAAREVQRAYDTDTQKAINTAAVGSGAFGGARHGVVESEAQRNKNQAIGDIYTSGLSNAYNSALGAYQNAQNTTLQGANQAAGLGQLQQGLGTADTELLLRSGEYQRQLPQQNLDLAYQDFLRQYQDPYAKSQYATSILAGVPYGQQSTTTGTQPPTSPLSQVGGLGLGAAGLYQMCERRLKRDIVSLGKSLGGVPLYLFRYVWSPRWVIGPMVDEVERLRPDAVLDAGEIRLVNMSVLAGSHV